MQSFFPTNVCCNKQRISFHLFVKISWKSRGNHVQISLEPIGTSSLCIIKPIIELERKTAWREKDWRERLRDEPKERLRSRLYLPSLILCLFQILPRCGAGHLNRRVLRSVFRRRHLLWQLATNWHYSKAAFLWSDPDLDQWSQICLDHAHQRNRWIQSGHGFTGSFDAPWSRQILDHWFGSGLPQRNAA